MATPVSRFMRKDEPENRAYSIRCRDCGQRSQLMPSNPTGTLPPEMVKKKFQQRGWEVGSTPRKDVCPECQKRDDMRVAKVDKNLRAEIIDMHPKEVITLPEKMELFTREDRRVVLAKLNEVYQDEKTGYRPGWSDDKVAKDLGVGLKWVQDLRSENFGDLPVSAIDKAFLDEARQVLEELRSVGQEARGALQDAKNMLELIWALDKKLDDLMAQEQLLAEQIAKVA